MTDKSYRSSENYLNSCPKVCQSCRWLDWYYELGCTQGVYPVENVCIFHTRSKLFKLLWLGKKYDLHYHLWRIKIWFSTKILRQKPNFIGSWRQYEYEGDDK